jgi:hypothetical protein
VGRAELALVSGLHASGFRDAYRVPHGYEQRELAENGRAGRAASGSIMSCLRVPGVSVAEAVPRVSLRVVVRLRAETAITFLPENFSVTRRTTSTGQLAELPAGQLTVTWAELPEILVIPMLAAIGCELGPVVVPPPLELEPPELPVPVLGLVIGPMAFEANGPSMSRPTPVVSETWMFAPSSAALVV